MTFARRVVVLVIAAGLTMACGAYRSRTQQPKGRTTVVLLPESDGSVGRATVSNPSGYSRTRDSTSLDTRLPRAQPPGRSRR